ncbi:lactate dehydrogenase [Mesoplasma syrphidae]|uniref:Lactate dehydrogenase n=1 Tax=Mesoplasma syrphidae TaxID=225999 RepID=A0A2K9CDP7_9MOLU|nr:NAD(P)-dependent oxidoreductase [Mesoplasma syrphidae]AUF83774.1 lactate dehydrogenase [Mesoplasma syrphidae]
MKILCYGVIKSEIPVFKKANEPYNNELIFKSELLNDENVNDLPEGLDAIVLFVNCDANAKNLQFFKNKGVKYIVTRTAGFDHIDLPVAKKLGYKIGRVPAYSPTAVASLGFAAGVSMLRKTAYICNQTANRNFKIDNSMLAKEFRNSVIGIIGTGKIGYETAKYWASVGATVLGYDIYENEKSKEYLVYTDLDTLLTKSDLVSLHIPYIKGQNEKFVNAKLISKMKNGATLINVARKNLVDLEAVCKAVKDNKLWGYAADVFDYEERLIHKSFDSDQLREIVPVLEEAIELYPRILITPHIAYLTDEAVKNMAEVSFANLQQLVETETCDNLIPE